MQSNFDPPDNAAWSLSGRAEINASHGAHSAPYALWLFGSHAFGSDEGSLASREFTVTPGQPFPVFAWINGDGHSSTVLNLFLTSGSAFVEYDLSASLGSGWQPWEPGVFVPETSTVLVEWYVGPPASIGSGAWVVDDFELGREAVDMASISKWSAISAAADVLKGLTGGDFNTNLEQRVYTRLLLPPTETSIKLPYACVPLEQEGETIEYEGFAFISTWRLVGYAFFEDNPESDVLNSNGAEQAAKFRDDLIRAFMADQTLSGAVQNCEVNRVETFSGSDSDATTWVVFTVEFTQQAGADDLVAQ